MKTLEEYRTTSWKDLTPEDLHFLQEAEVCNGCGGKGSRWWERLIRWILRMILRVLRAVFVEASCMIHDFRYWQGGDEARRKECDLGFFKAIIADIDQTQKTVFSVLWYTILALVFYYSVRIGGRSYFNYRT